MAVPALACNHAFHPDSLKHCPGSHVEQLCVPNVLCTTNIFDCIPTSSSICPSLPNGPCPPSDHISELLSRTVFHGQIDIPCLMNLTGPCPHIDTSTFLSVVSTHCATLLFLGSPRDHVHFEVVMDQLFATRFCPILTVLCTLLSHTVMKSNTFRTILLHAQPPPL